MDRHTVPPSNMAGPAGRSWILAVLVEEMGRALLPAPFFATVVLGGLTVLDAGDDDQKRDILTGVCAGTVRLTLALTEPSATTEAWGVETQASASGDGYSISGTKLFVPDAHAADTLIVAARTMPAGDDPEQGITLFLVPSNAAGVEIEQVGTIGNERLCEVRLSNVSVAAGAVLGSVGEAWPVIERALARATAAHCVHMVGGAEAVVDMTVEYVKQRTQFGRPVGSFQAVQHHCANMATDVEGARHVALPGGVGPRRGPVRSARGRRRQGMVQRRLPAGLLAGSPVPRRHRLHPGAQPAALHAPRQGPGAFLRQRPRPQGGGVAGD